MEEISAARAMEWSIELEKGLRSNNPGQRIEAIEQIGNRLQQWSTEPGITMGISNMYSLVPGEDRLFANTILLRLADAFRCGDINTRKSILKIFLIESKHLIKKGRRYNGILSKQRVPNYVELLRRVKTVFDTGDVEAKCLALSLFGCWADLAKDSVQIRYMILLSLQSSHVSEVKASLFAVGYFCILSEDFACIALEILIGIISFEQTSSDVKLDAIRAFSKMRCSFLIVNRAYQAGKTLLPSLQENELKAEMLSSLSKLTFDSSLLVSQQADLLLSYVSNDSASLIRARALKCLYFLFSRVTCCLAVERNILCTLLNIIDDKELSPNFRSGALRILQKVLFTILPDLSRIDMSNLYSLLLVVKNAMEYSARAERFFAIHLLVDILCSLKIAIREQWCSSPEKWDSMKFQNSADITNGDGPTRLVCHVIISISDQMNHLANYMCFESGVALPESKQEFKSLLNLILRLIPEYPLISHNVLKMTTVLIQTFVSMNGKMVNHTVSELMLCTCRFTIAFLKILDEKCAFNNEVFHIMKSLVDCMNQNGSLCFDTYEFFSLNIHSVKFNYHWKNKNGGMDSEESTVVHWTCLEWHALKLIKKMIKERNYWAAYRAGVYACCKGTWFSAAFTFRKLMDILKSYQCRSWFRSLILLAGSESKIKLLLFPKVGIQMISFMQDENDCGKTFSSIESEMNEYRGGGGDLHGCEGRFTEIYGKVLAAKESLASLGDTDGVYYFHRWLLGLRAKVIETFAGMLDLLYSHTFTEENLNTSLHAMPALASRFAGISLRLNKIAKEYDLLAVSFLDIDSKSFRSISRQAFGCSVIAFCTSFGLCFSNSPAFKNAFSSSLGEMQEIQITVLKDLIERLWNVDEELTTELQQLLAVYMDALNTVQLPNERNSSIPDKVSFLMYKVMIEGVLHIQEDSKEAKDDEGLCQLLLQGLKLLSGILKRWVEIPSSLPKYFFRVRPCIGAELFMFSAAPKSTTELSVTPGFQLSLNLCIQLKNAARDPHVQLTKIYCLLAVYQSDCKTSGKQARWDFPANETDKMIELYNILLHHIRTYDTKDSKRNFDVDGNECVTTFVCFEPNQRGQGFSTCLIDVSSFPEGSYPIKWQSCCIDKNGHLWSLLPMNSGSVFTIKES